MKLSKDDKAAAYDILYIEVTKFLERIERKIRNLDYDYERALDHHEGYEHIDPFDIKDERDWWMDRYRELDFILNDK